MLQPHLEQAHRATDGFLPHGFCYLWNKPLLYTHLVADLLIGVSYVVISFALAALVHRARRDIPFQTAFVAFGLFIITCGLTHFMEIWTLWEPVYWLSGYVKAVTAVASVSTAVAMPFMVPRVHTVIRDAKRSREREVEGARSAALQEANTELTHLNASLQSALAAAQREREAADHARLVAEEANAAKASFLAVMSHELRTPLNAVMGYTDLMAMGVSGPVTAAQTEQLGRIRSSASHLVGLIDQVLQFAQVEAGKDDLIVEAVDVAALARETAAMLLPLAVAKELRVNVHVPDEPVLLTTDARRARQILLNLLSNAVKYTTDGEVVLSLRRESEPRGDVVFDVTDTGIGIAPEHLERVFDPFWQVEHALTRTAGGTGLGLSVSRQLATRLGGSLSVESRPGVGSTFTLRLPSVTRGPAADTGPTIR